MKSVISFCYQSLFRCFEDCLEDDGLNMDEYTLATHPILALESKDLAEYKTVPQDLFNQLVAGLRAAWVWEAMDEWEHNGR